MEHRSPNLTDIERFRAIRDILGMTQIEFATALKIGRGKHRHKQISHYERGNRKLSPARLRAAELLLKNLTLSEALEEVAEREKLS